MQQPAMQAPTWRAGAWATRLHPRGSNQAEHVAAGASLAQQPLQRGVAAKVRQQAQLHL